MEFKCPICNQFFKCSSEAINHMKSGHGLNKQVHEFPCLVNNQCKKHYVTLKGLKQHMKKCPK